jgi:predicted transcriptional regulator
LEHISKSRANYKLISTILDGVLFKLSREQVGMTQEEVARRLGTKKSVISRIETRAEDIRLSTVRKYAKALGKQMKLEIS